MATELNEATVRHVAHLARLTVSDEEVARYTEQLSSILTYFEQLRDVDTTDVPPTAHARPISNVFHNDEIVRGCTPDDALANAPQQEGSFFGVPKVLDQGDA